MLPILLRVLLAIGYLLILPIFLVYPLTVTATTKYIMYGLCVFMAFFNSYEAWRHHKRRKTTTVMRWD